MYLIFGVLTTLFSWLIYYGALWAGRSLLSLPAEDTTSPTYIGLYTVSQILQWIGGVLFAFFTNKKWVFTSADANASTGRQLGAFAGSRVVTFFLDWGITLGLTLLLAALWPTWQSAVLLGRTLNLCEILSKVVAAVVVVISNYIISKFFVFRKKKDKISSTDADGEGKDHE